MHRATLTLFAAALGACASLADLGKSLDTLVGQDVRTVFQRLGYPDGKQTYGEDTVYTWERRDSYSAGGPSVGIGVGTGFGGIAFGHGTPTVEYCRIKLVARGDRVISHESNGSYSACKPYQDRLITR